MVKPSKLSDQMDHHVCRLQALLWSIIPYLECEPLPRQRLPRLYGDVYLPVDQPLRVARALRLPEQVVHPIPGALHVGSERVN